ncbi:hypothetical protein C8F01DRAFT_48305 [Mycena amicta]|nr:hypothetical protein C8F01DRAFT_48305 [Mycena amicta]
MSPTTTGRYSCWSELLSPQLTDGAFLRLPLGGISPIRHQTRMYADGPEGVNAETRTSDRQLVPVPPYRSLQSFGGSEYSSPLRTRRAHSRPLLPVVRFRNPTCAASQDLCDSWTPASYEQRPLRVEGAYPWIAFLPTLASRMTCFQYHISPHPRRPIDDLRCRWTLPPPTTTNDLIAYASSVGSRDELVYTWRPKTGIWRCGTSSSRVLGPLAFDAGPIEPAGHTTARAMTRGRIGRRAEATPLGV